MSTTENCKKSVLDEMESSGVINQLRAKIKSSVIQIVKSKGKDFKQKVDFELYTTFQKQAKKTKELMLLSHLILEFMTFYELEYTVPIYQNETNIKEIVKKETLIKDCSLSNNYDKEQPLLLQVFNTYLKDKKFEGQCYKNDKEYSAQGLASIMSGGGGLGLSSFGKFNNAATSTLLEKENSKLGISSDSINQDISNMSGFSKNKKLVPLSFVSPTPVAQSKCQDGLI